MDDDGVALAQFDCRPGDRSIVCEGVGGLPGSNSSRAGAAVRLTSTTPGVWETFCRTGGETNLSAEAIADDAGRT